MYGRKIMIVFFLVEDSDTIFHDSVHALVLCRQLPPHLSPFVDNEAEDYLPDYAKKIKLLQSAARKETFSLLDASNHDDADPNNLLAEAVADRVKAKEAAERKHRVRMHLKCVRACGHVVILFKKLMF